MPGWQSLALLFVLLGLSAQGVSAQPEADPAGNRDFDLPASESAELLGDGGHELSSFDFTGNPLSDLMGAWPEDLVIAPIPGRSPQLGWQLTVGGGYFLDSDARGSDTPSSIIGGFAMTAENGSWAVGGGSYLHLFDDDLRVKFGAAQADVRYEYFGVGQDVNRLDVSLFLRQKMPLYFGSATYRIWKRLYMGLGYMGGEVDTDTTVSIEIPEQNIVNPVGKVNLGAWVVPFEWDSRDHQQFPREGWKVDGRAMFFSESSGSDFNAETYQVAANHYRPMREQDVLATRLMMRWTKGDAPFFLKSSFGGSTDLRGYAAGRFRDNMMYAVQTEYRWRYSNDWIFTGFVGVGEVAQYFGDFGDYLLPAAGLGARYVLSKKHRVGLSFDVATGRTGTEFYVGVGEAF